MVARPVRLHGGLWQAAARERLAAVGHISSATVAERVREAQARLKLVGEDLSALPEGLVTEDDIYGESPGSWSQSDEEREHQLTWALHGQTLRSWA
jgi:hypothetical protein